MARICSFEEIIEDRLPTPEAFSDATQVFGNLVDNGIEEGWIDGAFIYGSVALGLANQCSDLDALLALTDSSPATYRAARELVRTVQSSSDRKIPFAPTVQPKLAFETGRHEMDRFFGEHLTSEYRIVRGRDPASYITYRPDSAYTILATYMSQKKRHLTSSFTTYSTLNLNEGNGVQRMLELPSAVGRKALQALAETGYVETVNRNSTKANIVDRMRTVLKNEGIESGFDTLARFDGDYWDLFNEAATGVITKETYNDGIRGLHAQLPLAINWLDTLERALLPKLKASE